MPILKSAKKALKQSKVRYTRNKAKTTKYKNLIKQMKKYFVSNDKDSANKLLPLIYKAIDKAVKSNLIHINKGSRMKASLCKMVK